MPQGQQTAGPKAAHEPIRTISFSSSQRASHHHLPLARLDPERLKREARACLLRLFTIRIAEIRTSSITFFTSRLGQYQYRNVFIFDSSHHLHHHFGSRLRSSSISRNPCQGIDAFWRPGLQLAQARILGLFTAFSVGKNAISAVKSSDNRASWQRLGEVIRGASNANDIDNFDFLKLPTRRVLCAFGKYSKDLKTGVCTYFYITVTCSDDKGISWAYLSTPASDAGPVNGNWEPFLRLARDNSL